MTHIILLWTVDILARNDFSDGRALGTAGRCIVMLRRSLPLDWYRQQRAIIDVVRDASLSEEKISVKTRERIAISPEKRGPGVI